MNSSAGQLLSCLQPVHPLYRFDDSLTFHTFWFLVLTANVQYEHIRFLRSVLASDFNCCLHFQPGGANVYDRANDDYDDNNSLDDDDNHYD